MLKKDEYKRVYLIRQIYIYFNYILYFYLIYLNSFYFIFFFFYFIVQMNTRKIDQYWYKY